MNHLLPDICRCCITTRNPEVTHALANHIKSTRHKVADNQWIGWMGKIYRKALYSMGKSMVSVKIFPETNPMKQTWSNFVPMGLKSTGQCHNRFGLEFLNSLQRNVQSGLDTLAAPSKPIFENTTLKKVIWLVVLTCFNHLEKYESQLGWLFPIYGKIVQMFKTTNQNASRPLLRRARSTAQYLVVHPN